MNNIAFGALIYPKADTKQLKPILGALGLTLDYKIVDTFSPKHCAVVSSQGESISKQTEDDVINRIKQRGFNRPLARIPDWQVAPASGLFGKMIKLLFYSNDEQTYNNAMVKKMEQHIEKNKI